MVVITNKNNFDELIQKGKVIIDFYADWCGPCKMLAPIFEQLSDEMEEVIFAKVDVEQEQELARRFNVSSIPTLLIFENGVLKQTERGYFPKEKLKSFLST